MGDGRRLGVRRGRTAPRRGRSVRARLTDEEYAELAEAAGRAGLTVTGYVAEAALASARDTKPPASTAPWKEALVEVERARAQVAKFGNNVNQAVRTLHATGEVPAGLQGAVRTTRDATARLDQAADELHRKLP